MEYGIRIWERTGFWGMLQTISPFCMTTFKKRKGMIYEIKKSSYRNEK